MTKKLAVVGVVVVSLLFGFLLGERSAHQQDATLGGTIHNVQESFDAGIAVNGTEVINSSGQYTGGVSSSLAVSLGAETTLGNCTTGSYTVPALGPVGERTATSWATTSVTVSGLTNGDTPIALGWTPQSATGTLIYNGIVANVEATTGTTAIVTFHNITNTTSSAIATGTYKVCYFN